MNAEEPRAKILQQYGYHKAMLIHASRRYRLAKRLGFDQSIAFYRSERMVHILQIRMLRKKIRKEDWWCT